MPQWLYPAARLAANAACCRRRSSSAAAIAAASATEVYQLTTLHV